jgi:hypothetical protein
VSSSLAGAVIAQQSETPFSFHRRHPPSESKTSQITSAITSSSVLSSRNPSIPVDIIEYFSLILYALYRAQLDPNHILIELYSAGR